MTTTATSTAPQDITERGRPGKSIASLLGSNTVLAKVAAPCRLSESRLWDRQRQFYDADPAGIWGNAVVPHYITGNPRIASTYARLALSFLRQVQHPPIGADGVTDTAAADVLHIIELGGGSGRFAFLFVQQLRELAPDLRFLYVLTDFAPDRLAQWRDHPSFQALVADGFLDFALLDADHLAPLDLVVSGRRVAPGSLQAPVIGVANYVFDSLRHDSYAIRQGELFDCHLSYHEAAETPADSLLAAEPLPSAEWQVAPAGPISTDLQPVLDFYTETLDDTVVLVPVGGLRCLDFLASLTIAASCTLVADKGHRSISELCTQDAPALVPHGSGFSLMVNFDLLARWTEQRGGAAILPPEPARSLVVAAILRGDVDAFPAFAASFHDELVDVGPDNYFALRSLLTTAASTTIEPVLALLRFSRFDPSLFVELFPTLLEILPAVPEARKNEVERVFHQVWKRYFPIGEPLDVALCIGLSLSAMQRHGAAVRYLTYSQSERATSPESAFAMAAAKYGQRDLAGALLWANRALELEPTFSEARALRISISDDLRANGSCRDVP